MCFSRVKWLALAVLFLSACHPQIVTLTPPPTPETWLVEYTPALRWLGPIFQTCAAGLPGAALVVNERPASQLGRGPADFSFQWGDRAASTGFTAVIATDDLVVVVNPANPLNGLTPDDVAGLFEGKITGWGQLRGTDCATCGSAFEGTVQAYVLAPGEDVRTAAAWIPSGPAALLAPGPAEVRAAVAKERFALGYLPARWLDASVRAVPVQPTIAAQTAIPVLVFAPDEPQGARRAWLACVQAALQ